MLLLTDCLRRITGLNAQVRLGYTLWQTPRLSASMYSMTLSLPAVTSQLLPPCYAAAAIHRSGNGQTVLVFSTDPHLTGLRHVMVRTSADANQPEPIEALMAAMMETWARPEVAFQWVGAIPGLTYENYASYPLRPALVLFYRSFTSQRHFVRSEGIAKVPGLFIDSDDPGSEVMQLERALTYSYGNSSSNSSSAQPAVKAAGFYIIVDQDPDERIMTAKGCEVKETSEGTLVEDPELELENAPVGTIVESQVAWEPPDGAVRFDPTA